jgi:hypothetical protein
MQNSCTNFTAYGGSSCITRFEGLKIKVCLNVIPCRMVCVFVCVFVCVYIYMCVCVCTKVSEVLSASIIRNFYIIFTCELWVRMRLYP